MFLKGISYRWLFYIEGALTIAIAIIAIFVLPDFPTTTRWLSPQERALAIKRMEEDAGVGDEQETEQGAGTGFWMAITDWKVWWLSLALTSQVVALSFNAYFPTLSATLGYNRTVTLLLCAPPFVFAALVAFWLSRYGRPRYIPDINNGLDADTTDNPIRWVNASITSLVHLVLGLSAISLRYQP